MFRYIKPLFPFLLGWGLLLLTPNFQTVAWVNGIAQILLFALVVCLPAWRTGRMSYVDIGWPWGLVVIGITSYLMIDGGGIRQAVISLVYLFIGARMGMGALAMWSKGAFRTEFPRYQYQRLRWKEEGKDRVMLAIQIEALLQGIANASFLAFPAFVIASNPQPEISGFEIAGLLLWIAAFVMESIADVQKIKFLAGMKRRGERDQVCNVGLWRYSRHPNYFAEWMVWNGLVIASIPSWLRLYDELNPLNWILLGGGLLFASRIMYTTLVYYTGAVPAEYFSVQKRPAYKDYQKQTNRFFPGPVK